MSNSLDAPAEASADASTTERWAHIVQQTSLCGRQLRRVLAAFAVPWNVSDTEFLLLWACNQALENGLRQNDLAHKLGVSPAQMSGLVYDLRDRGLLTFERPQHDRRRQVLKITGQGRLLLSRILESLAPLVARLEQFISHDEQQLIEKLLERIIAAVDDMPGPQRVRPTVDTNSPSVLRRAS